MAKTFNLLYLFVYWDIGKCKTTAVRSEGKFLN